MKPTFIPALHFIRESKRTQRWFWKGIIPADGVHLVAAEPYTGKTTLLAALAVASVNDMALAERPVKRRRVAFMHLEHGSGELSDKLRRAAKGLGVGPYYGLRRDLFIRRAAFDIAKDVPELAQELDASNVGVLVIDSLRCIGDFNENDPQETSAVMKGLRSLAGHERLVLVTHHMSKGGTIRGSTALVAHADGHLELKRQSGSVLMRRETRSQPELRLRLGVDFNSEALRFALSTPKEANGSEVEEAVFKVIASGVNTQSAVRKQTGGSSGRVDGAIRALIEKGRVIDQGSSGKHQYVVNPKPLLPRGSP